MSDKCFIAGIVSVITLLVFSSRAVALPWDTDMAKQPSFKANELVRAPVRGTVPIGAVQFPSSPEEAEKVLTNPIALNRDSVWRGQRLWNANCFPCHGKVGDGKGVVGMQMSVPSLLTEMYQARTDQRMFYAIHNGLGNMPRYGYKFSVNDHWNLVNYLRFLQGREVPGFKRP